MPPTKATNDPNILKCGYADGLHHRPMFILSGMANLCEHVIVLPVISETQRDNGRRGHQQLVRSYHIKGFFVGFIRSLMAVGWPDWVRKCSGAISFSFA